MFEFLKPKGSAEPGPETNGSAPEVKIPTFEELNAALPENLRDEFQRLHNMIKGARTGKDEAGDTVTEVEEEETMSSDDLKAYDRYGQLTRQALDNIEKKA
jgi:hypothetical protein